MLPQRNPDSERCAIAGAAGHADLSSVHLRNLSGNRQAKPEAVAAPAGIRTIEAVKNMGQRRRRNGRTGIVHTQLTPVLLFLRETVTFFSSPAYLMLKAIGLYTGEITGSIGSKTDAAIRSFQKKYGLTVDGIPGTQTISRLTSVYLQSGTSTASGVNLSVETVRSAQTMLKELGYYAAECTGHFGSKTLAALQAAARDNGSGTPDFASSVLDLHWFNEKSFYLSHGISTGSTITDILTGKTFHGRIRSTGYHTNVEPKTAEDTKTMCAIWGVSDAESISYLRRAIPVKATVNGTTHTYAASMYGEVHGAQTIADNDYDGQFCVHFRHSTTSDTQIEYAENQQPIDVAVNYATQKLGMTHITDSAHFPAGNAHRPAARHIGCHGEVEIHVNA